jgi:hypothetical protein
VPVERSFDTAAMDTSKEVVLTQRGKKRRLPVKEKCRLGPIYATDALSEQVLQRACPGGEDKGEAPSPGGVRVFLAQIGSSSKGGSLRSPSPSSLHVLKYTHVL